jgi:chromosome segregation ATPase
MMARPTAAEKLKNTQLQPKTADELHAEQLTIEAELEALPSRIQQAKDLASDSIDDKIIADALATVAELKQKETTLKIQHWHAKRSYLLAAREEALQASTRLPDTLVKAREELSQAQKAVKEATSRASVTEQKFKSIAGQLTSASIRAQELLGELQRHEQARPQL